MRGRPPQPPHLTLLRGNPSRRPMRSELRVEILTELPAPPEFLTDPAAVEAWHQLGGELVRASVLSKLDLGPLAVYAELRGRWAQATQLLNELDPSDKRVPPLIRIQRDAARDLIAFAQQFGATPASRARVSSAFDAPSSKFGDLIGGEPA